MKKPEIRYVPPRGSRQRDFWAWECPGCGKPIGTGNLDDAAASGYLCWECKPTEVKAAFWAARRRKQKGDR